jgi:hypothetical protein
MKHTYKILFMVFAAASLLTGCNLDVNEDPNRVTDKTITGELLFVGGAVATGQRVGSDNLTFLNNWLGYWSGSGTFAIDATETTYNITPDFGNTMWQNYYNTLYDLKLAGDKSLASGDTVIAGASMILSARLWQDLVDMYNNIPYSQAFQYLKYPQPVYDKGEDIYNDLQKKLDLAISYMHKKPLSTLASYDIVNQGNTAKWIHFANTLKLKLLIHQSELGVDPSAEIAKIIAEGGVLESGETVSVNPGFTKATNKQSPFYDNFGKTVNDADAAPSVKANAYLFDLLADYGDQRVYFYFDSAATGGAIVPTVYGLTAGNPASASGVGPGLANNPSQDQWIFTSVESLFLKAEAIARGWMSGDVVAAYNAAVTESFIFLNVEFKGKKIDKTDSIVSPGEEAAYYLQSPDSKAVADFSTYPDSTVAKQIKFIAFQKYLAMAGIDPIEAWSDLRRLGFDVIPIETSEGDTYITANPGTLSTDEIPSRLLYPQNEYTTNATNAHKEGTINQFTSKIFWDAN